MTAALALSPVDVFDALTDTPAASELAGSADPYRAAARVAQPDFARWFDTVGSTARGCSGPVRLVGTSTTTHAKTGELVEQFSTDSLPDQMLYKPCGSRLASKCPACAEVYRYDTYHLIAAGMRGGKGVPESVAAHPAVFVTVTAPSFGPVHSANIDRRSGRIRPCRPRRYRPVCPHGRPMSCPQRHSREDPCVGSPLCFDCYDYDRQIAFNAFAPHLWARTIDALNRRLRRHAKARRVTFIPVGYLDAKGKPRTRWVAPVRLRYAKVAEFQARGVVHLHAIVRLDGYHPDDPDTVLPPSALITAADVCQLIRAAAANTAVATPEHPDRPEGWPLTWGEQIDTRIIRAGISDAQVTEQHVAGYLAKYATKSTEAVGPAGADLNSTNPAGGRTFGDSYLRRLLDTCWRLGRAEAERYDRLRPKANMLGFSGHFSTKSRRYSTTLGALRAARRPSSRAGVRIIRAADFDTAEHIDDDSTLIVNAEWTYNGTGWLTTADAALANASAAAARERRPKASEA